MGCPLHKMVPPALTNLVTDHPIAVGVAAAIIAVVYFYLGFWTEYTLPYNNLPGPPTASLLLGNMKEIAKNAPHVYQSKWHAQYGPTIRFPVLFGGHRLLTKDTRALAYIVNNSDTFIKPPQMSRILTNLIGAGVLTVEEGHRRQRRVLNPAFGLPAVKNMMPIFWEHSYTLVDKIQKFLDEPDLVASPTPPKPEDIVPGARKIDVCKYVAQTTLDVIGIAGFDYEFGSLQDRPNALSDSFLKMFSALWWNRIGLMVNCHAEDLPTKERTLLNNLRRQSVVIAKDIVARKKRQVEAEYSGALEKGDRIGSDLLSLMIRANMAPDLRPDQRLTDEEVVDQISTFMFAGNETSSSALSWGLYRLAQNKAVQHKLREELLAFGVDKPDYDELNSLPYLEAVVHEIVRYDPPVAGTPRMANADVVIPLGHSVVGRDGTTMDSVKLRKGDQIYVPITTVNRSTDIWGPDAEQFNPDRFQKETFAGDKAPGVYGNLMTFLGGPRNCIGWRFALAEIKAILFVLIRNFEFDELPSRPEMVVKPSIIMRPTVRGEEEHGLQLPLLIRPITNDD